jgi:ribonucleoside-diphosphate reductase alpha chain
MKRDPRPALSPAPPSLPPQEVATEVLLEKYAKGLERDAADVLARTARALARDDDQARRFLDAMRDGFVPGGRIASAAGTALQATLINCFVQPIGDFMAGEEDGVPGIMRALEQAAETMRRGGGVGYDFSPIRPRGATVRGTMSRASGPVSYMRVYDAMCKTVESAGARRGAQMGVLRCDHPDIGEFVAAKRTAGELTQFNVSVAVTDALMQAVETDGEFDLVHDAQPSADIDGAFRRDDGRWVYRRVRARALWDTIMRSAHASAEPGVLFIDTINALDNLSYCETIAASNPCGEQMLPAYGCCDLGSIDLTRVIERPFRPDAAIDWDTLRRLVRTGVEILDRVLDVTLWPLPQQAVEARAKRRIGLGFLGLGDALILLGQRYDSQEGRRTASRIAAFMCHEAYGASVELARTLGAFPLFDAARYLSAPRFASTLPQPLRDAIARHGIRNSHLLSIAPTGTISLAFADNASNGIEPAYSWSYTRRKRMADGSVQAFRVHDHAFRMWRSMQPDPEAFDAALEAGAAALPEAFVSALQMRAQDHLMMVAAVAPHVDSAISKTVNVPAETPLEDTASLYVDAWRMGLKGLTIYRPNDVTGAVLSVDASGPEPATGGTTPPSLLAPDDLQQSDADRRIALKAIPAPALASLRWPDRPHLPAGNPSWTVLVEHPAGDFAVVVGHVEQGGRARPFEVWVTGNEQPRGLAAIAKTLSMDLRCDDPAWVAKKLDSLAATPGQDGFVLELDAGRPERVPSLVAGLARIVRHRCDALGLLDGPPGPTPMLDALISRKEPKTGTDGTMSWSVDVSNPATGDDIHMIVKELTLPDGTRRPYSVWLAGSYPRTFDGLTKLLSIDMRIVDAAWIGRKLVKLVAFAEPRGDFWAPVPGEAKSRVWPSTIAYLARLLLHRYRMLGILDVDGTPRAPMQAFAAGAPSGALAAGGATSPRVGRSALPTPVVTGRDCPECHNPTLARVDGCDRCGHCGWIGTCG